METVEKGSKYANLHADQFRPFFQSNGLLTTSSGLPVDDLTNSMSAGPRGPLVLQDLALIDTMAHFDRERIPERVVHAKGAGAFGYFEVTHDITDICKVGELIPSHIFE